MFGNVLTLQTAHGSFLMLCQMVLLPNINFLISKQNKTPKIDPKMLKQQAGIVTFRHTLFFTQTSRALELNINTANRYTNTNISINCIYSLACFCFDANTLNTFSCLVCTCNRFHNILRLSYVLPNFPSTTSETMGDYYL